MSFKVKGSLRIVLGLKVPKKKAEEVRKILLRKNALLHDFEIFRDGAHVYFPVSFVPEGLEGYSGDFNFKRKERRPRNLREALEPILTEEELRALVRSFDVIGDIAIIEIPEELEDKQGLIGEAIMKVHKNVRVVARKMGETKGIYRTRPLKIIAGERRFETVHREHGVVMKLDVSKVYFSPRLSFERLRIAKMVRPGEVIAALFAGVGPFPLVIAKKQPKVKKIYAVELNPVACRYMRENVKLNGFQDLIEVIEGDVREVVPSRLRSVADRVLMPLPKGAHEFLREAFLACREGAIVHFYTFAREEEMWEKPVKIVEEKAEEEGRRVEILGVRKVRPYAPRVYQMVVDFKVFSRL